MKLFHGSPFLFNQFDLTGAGKGTGIKFGFGVYLTESEASAEGENGSTFFLSVLLMKSFRSIKLKTLVGKMKSARCMSL